MRSYALLAVAVTSVCLAACMEVTKNDDDGVSTEDALRGGCRKKGCGTDAGSTSSDAGPGTDSGGAIDSGSLDSGAPVDPSGARIVTAVTPITPGKAIIDLTGTADRTDGYRANSLCVFTGASFMVFCYPSHEWRTDPQQGVIDLHPGQTYKAAITYDNGEWSKAVSFTMPASTPVLETTPPTFSDWYNTCGFLITASDESGVDHVDFFANGQLVTRANLALTGLADYELRPVVNGAIVDSPTWFSGVVPDALRGQPLEIVAEIVDVYGNTTRTPPQTTTY